MRTNIMTAANKRRRPTLVRQNFTNTVVQAMKELMEEHGYSRERAASAILREICGNISTPEDDEVFGAMRKHGIGNHHAVRALNVAAAIQQHSREYSISSFDAVEKLTEKLAHAKLAHQAQHSEELAPSVDLRITPPTIPSMPKKLNSKSLKPTTNCNNIVKTTNSRKRSKEATDQAETTRARAHSVTDEVSAKLEEDITKATPSSAVRTKRSRSEGGDSKQPSSVTKRPRSNAA